MTGLSAFTDIAAWEVLQTSSTAIQGLSPAGAAAGVRGTHTATQSAISRAMATCFISFIFAIL